ncbi:MAG TPA: heme ABC transporter permease, partial [Rudaea sp.]
RAAAFLALVGVVNLPIVHYSVIWWNTLHQAQTVSLVGQSHIDSSMLWPLLTLAFATHVYFFASLLARARAMLLGLESGKEWVRSLALPPDPATEPAHV